MNGIRVIASALGLLLLAQPAWAIPAFARKYHVSCSMCHAPPPRLNAFGETFAANGFEFAAGEPARDTIATGDPLLRLMRDLPLAIRFDAYAVAVTDATAAQVPVDLQTPWLIKLLSGGQVADRISYYFYFFMSERGEVAGLEDAYLQFTDIAGSGVSALVGQFQVSDPLFRRELRLEYQDYAPYRVRVGDASLDLTYDRGVMVSYSPWSGADASAQVVNGRGLGHATEAIEYDEDSAKNVMLRLAQQVGPLRLGGFGYLGSEKAAGEWDQVRMWGPDASLAVSPRLQLNAQYVRRTDDNPFFGPAAPHDVAVDAGFAELVWLPQGPAGRVALTALYNIVDADQPLFTLGLGEEDLLQRYRSLALGGNYLARRNVRLTAEAAWDFEAEQARFVAGFMTAF